MSGDKDMAGKIARPEAAAGTAMVRVDALRNFPETVRRLGGDPGGLLARAGIDPDVLASRHAVVPYLSLARLLQQAAGELSCPDFGMRLAAGQDGIRAFGPLEVAMRNCATLRSAFTYCASHMQVYSTATRLAVEEESNTGAAFLRLDLELPDAALLPQAVEQMLLLLQDGFADLSGGKVRASEVRFSHERIAPLQAYEDYFGTTVKFGQEANGLQLAAGLLDNDIAGADPQLYELAAYFIEVHYPPHEGNFSARVGALIEQLLPEGRCAQGEVAAMLGIGSRALQRRLQAENTSFEAIRDGVRREIALRHLRQADVPLIRVAQLLGYSDTSVLTRSCYRWFSASPRQLRKAAAAEVP